jgi:hypothetical protein
VVSVEWTVTVRHGPSDPRTEETIVRTQRFFQRNKLVGMERPMFAENREWLWVAVVATVVTIDVAIVLGALS